MGRYRMISILLILIILSTYQQGIIAVDSSKLERMNSIKKKKTMRMYGNLMLNKLTIPRNSIALTFDDGPNPKTLKKAKETLNKYNVKATFFMTGSNIEKNPELHSLILDLIRDGHWVGSHTHHHKQLPQLSPQDAIVEFKKTSEVFLKLTGKDAYIIREPYGLSTTKVDEFLRENDMISVRWSMDLRDWDCQGKSECVVDRLKTRLKDASKMGGIVLLHEYVHTMEVLETLIKTILESNFSLVTLTDFMTKDYRDKLSSSLSCKTTLPEDLYYALCVQLDPSLAMKHPKKIINSDASSFFSSHFNTIIFLSIFGILVLAFGAYYLIRHQQKGVTLPL